MRLSVPGRVTSHVNKKAVAGEVVADADEQRLVARILELRGEGQSLREVGAVLDAEGFKPRSGGKWHPTVIARIEKRAEG